MDARSRLTSVACAYGEVVWVRRPGAGVKSEVSESFQRRWWQQSRSPGRSRISRKAIAQGRPDASAKPVCSCAAFCCISRTRDRGCGAHPVFPVPSLMREGKRNAKLRADHAARPRRRVHYSFNVIASVAKQSTSPHKERMDCFATLAMTWFCDVQAFRRRSNDGRTLPPLRTRLAGCHSFSPSCRSLASYRSAKRDRAWAARPAADRPLHRGSAARFFPRSGR